MPASDPRPGPGQRGGFGFGLSLLLVLLHAAMFIALIEPLWLWPLAFLAPAPLAWMAVRARTTPVALGAAMVGLIPMWLWTERWLTGVTLAGYPLLVLYLSSYGVAFTWLIRRFAHRRRTARLPMTLLVPLVWVALEFIRGEIIFRGYAWYLLGQSLVDRPEMAQSADLLGTYLVSFLAAAVAGAVVDLLRVRSGDLSRRVLVPSVAALAVAHGANVAYGLFRLAQTEVLRDGPTILVVQTNLPQSNKIRWELEAQVRDVASFVALTREAFEDAGGDTDLIVWPETMLPVRGLERATLDKLAQWGHREEVAFAEAAFGLTRDLGVPALIGSLHYNGLDVDQDTMRWVHDGYHNSAYLIGPDADLQRYDKIHLTPFGEVMPYISAWPWLEERVLGIGAPGMSFDMEPGSEPNRLSLRWADHEVTIGTPICFEDTVAGVCRAMVHDGRRKTARLLVNLSNDGWFGTHDGARMQHAHASRMRCIENRVPMVRAANTGVSISIDSSGRVVDTVAGDGRFGPTRVSGWMRTEVRLDTRRTLAGRVGELWPISCLVVVVGLMMVTLRRFDGGRHDDRND
ncbi:MAG: apolipoprotein N-acyltransferase [Planctomycetes bacterium]|nr:apolipoprotein N-acyltransferase [Planctomycetota bacterium]